MYLVLLVKIMMCSKLRCQKSFKLKHISYQIGKGSTAVQPRLTSVDEIHVPSGNTQGWLVQRSRRGAARAEDAQGSPTQSHISPSILVYVEKTLPGRALTPGTKSDCSGVDGSRSWVWGLGIECCWLMRGVYTCMQCTPTCVRNPSRTVTLPNI